MLEEINFWRPEKVKFAAKLLVTIFVIAILIFAVYSWVLYNLKVRDSQMGSKPQPRQMPSSASADPNSGSSTNPVDTSLSPMPVQANPN